MRLVDFFRISVKVDRQVVALDDELELLEAYMDLMCTATKSSLRIRYRPGFGRKSCSEFYFTATC